MPNATCMPNRLASSVRYSAAFCSVKPAWTTRKRRANRFAFSPLSNAPLPSTACALAGRPDRARDQPHQDCRRQRPVGLNRSLATCSPTPISTAHRGRPSRSGSKKLMATPASPSVTAAMAGPDENEVEHLFEPFYRSTANGKSNRPGLGVGLTVCRRLVELQGGKIAARAREGGGSEFSFTVPCVDESPE